MPRLDAFVRTLFASAGSEILFESGKGASMSSPRGTVPLVRQPLSTQQIVGAFAEVLPEELARGFPRQGVTSFRYLAPDGAVQIRFELDGGLAQATVHPQPPDEAGAAPPPPTVASTPPSRAGSPTPASAGRAASAGPVGGVARRPATPTPPGPVPAPIPAPEIEERRHVRAPASSGEPREALHGLLGLLVEHGASDLHLSTGCPPSLRLDGEIVPVEEHAALPQERLEAMLWSIAPEKNHAEWKARHDTDFAYELPAARFRVNVFADRRGIGAAFRQIPANLRSAADLGVPAAVLELCALRKGLVLVTGPTGSGKSTTLAALVDHVNQTRDDHIITIEDPIEFVHPNKRCIVNQREVGSHTESFKAALRAALREDPDVVLVGELRDLETIAIAIETAETGHLVFGTLHTNTAPSTVDRIIDQFPADRQAQIRTMLSESLKGVVSQMLCRKIGGGRVAALEVLLCTSGVSNLIREGKTFQIPSVMQTSRGAGMVTLNDALLDLVKKKLVEPKEALLRAVAKAELKQALERAGFPIDVGAAA